MTPFAQRFDLIDPKRDSLEPDPEKDTELYVDQGGLTSKVMAALARRAPKVVVAGDYGTGKTHLLHVVMSLIDQDRFKAVYVKLDARGGKDTDVRHLHNDVMSRLDQTNVLRDCIAGAVDQESDGDLALAIRMLAKDLRDPVALPWLFATGPSAVRREKAGFSGSLKDVAGGSRYVEIWKTLARGYKNQTGRELLLLIDEAEGFRYAIRGRPVEMATALREMFDAAQKDFGVLMGLTIKDAEARKGWDEHPLMRPDVFTRIQDIRIPIPGIVTVEERERFIRSISDRLFRDPESFWHPAARRWFAEHLSTLSARKMSITRDPTQREAVKLLNRLAQDVMDGGWKLPLSAATVEAWGG